MRKLIALLLTAAMLLTLAACGKSDDKTTHNSNYELPAEDADYVITLSESDPVIDGGMATIAVVVGSEGVEDGGYNAALWRGVQNFCRSFNFMPQSYTMVEDTEAGAAAALRQAAGSGASMVVCAGDLMGTAVYQLQNNYPTVSYLLLDSEAHSADYSSYVAAPATHCVLFREEQAGYLAGYAAVMEGCTELGCLGSRPYPEVVNYAAGFLQGVNAAAVQKGVQARVRYWYCGTDQASEELTARMSGWYSEGCKVIFAVGGTLAQSCAEAAEASGGKVIAAEYDQSALSPTVITSAQKCFSRVVQQQLYAFYAAGARWDLDKAGTVERLGVSADAVALVTNNWKLNLFGRSDYADLLQGIAGASIKVERHGDPATLPETSNVVVEYLNAHS